MSVSGGSMLEAIKLCCERDERVLFKDLTFRVNAGEWIQITGGNGAGKTSLLRLLTGLSRPDVGEVCWQGKPLHQTRDNYHQNLLWIGHQSGIKIRLTVLENLCFFHHHDDFQHYFQALDQMGLAGYEDTAVSQLSAGQQRRVALARLWLTNARLWILDEPFTGLDIRAVESLTQRMSQHIGLGGSVILTTHQPVNIPADKIRQIALSCERAG